MVASLPALASMFVLNRNRQMPSDDPNECTGVLTTSSGLMLFADAEYSEEVPGRPDTRCHTCDRSWSNVVIFSVSIPVPPFAIAIRVRVHIGRVVDLLAVLADR